MRYGVSTRLQWVHTVSAVQMDRMFTAPQKTDTTQRHGMKASEWPGKGRLSSAWCEDYSPGRRQAEASERSNWPNGHEEEDEVQTASSCHHGPASTHNGICTSCLHHLSKPKRSSLQHANGV